MYIELLEPITRKWIYINNKKTHYQILDNGIVWNTITLMEMRGGKDKNGYHIVSLTLDGMKYTHKVHRLVAEAFIPNPHNLPEVNHKNGWKWDNDYTNLEWCTTVDNVHHACEHNLRQASLTKDVVIRVCELLQEGKYFNSDIARITGVSQGFVTKIKNRVNWKNISKDYDFSKSFIKGRKVYFSKKDAKNNLYKGEM